MLRAAMASPCARGRDMPEPFISSTRVGGARAPRIWRRVAGDDDAHRIDGILVHIGLSAFRLLEHDAHFVVGYLPYNAHLLLRGPHKLAVTELLSIRVGHRSSNTVVVDVGHLVVVSPCRPPKYHRIVANLLYPPETLMQDIGRALDPALLLELLAECVPQAGRAITCTHGSPPTRRDDKGMLGGRHLWTMAPSTSAKTA
mmetsp:Transcript_129924/g.363640  ORF Transcript_129924/g.363640 Transcript_129924/m.363640 type:complete len:200 (+) Transcript_129924:67-666(+)